VHGARDDQGLDEELGEEMGIGRALPVVVHLLDPRPREAAPDLRAPAGAAQGSAVIRLAMRTFAGAAYRALGRPSPPIGKFYSSAELSHLAGLALQTIVLKPWGWEALARAGFYTVAANLLQEKVVPWGVVGAIADLFRNDRPEDPQRLALARKFLGLGFMQYLLDHVAGRLKSPREM
jgi:hypothetical protein